METTLRENMTFESMIFQDHTEIKLGFWSTYLVKNNINFTRPRR